MVINANNGRKYTTKSRWIRIRFNANGDCYFTHYGKRYKLDQFERVHYPIMWEDKEGKLQYLSGYDTQCWYKPFLIEIHPDCECVRLWEQITEED